MISLSVNNLHNARKGTLLQICLLISQSINTYLVKRFDLSTETTY